MDLLQSIDFELAALYSEQTKISQKIYALQEARKVLQAVYTQPPGAISTVEKLVEAADVGITDAVRGAFRLNADRCLTPLQVRDIVASHGFDLSKYNNAMATIHQVIRRLLDGDEVSQHWDSDGKPTYQWGPKPTYTRTLAEKINPRPLSNLETLATLLPEKSVIHKGPPTGPKKAPR